MNNDIELNLLFTGRVCARRRIMTRNYSIILVTTHSDTAYFKLGNFSLHSYVSAACLRMHGSIFTKLVTLVYSVNRSVLDVRTARIAVVLLM